jgi:autotransporter-associated beta strand protein
MRKPNTINLIRGNLKHLALAVAVGASFMAGSASADTTINTGEIFTINDANCTKVDSPRTTWTWNDTGTLTMLNGATLQTWPTQAGPQDVINNDAILFSGTAGTITFKFNGNDTDFMLNGPLTSTATGAQTLAINTGNNGNGDRESVTINSGIPDGTGDGSTMGLAVTFRTQSGSTSWVNLPAVNTFTGPIALVKGDNVNAGYLTIGGTLTRNNGNTSASGTLGGGNYPGAISLDSNTILNYASSEPQTLAGAISGRGTLQVTGTGTLTLSGPNTYSGDTTVNSGASLVLDSAGALAFAVQNASANKLTGAGSATLDGAFVLDTSAVTAASGSWTLADVAAKSFGTTFSVTDFTEVDNVWTKVDGVKTWTFDEATAGLSLNSAGTITSFGIPGANGIIDNSALTIHLYVPTGTVLATLAPTYTLSSGTCPQPNDGVTAPTPTFASGPVHYIVTDGATKSDYTVTITVSSMPLAGLKVWLKADAINPADTTQVDASGNVLKWVDSSGIDNHATNNGASGQLQPTYVAGALNGQPALRFAASNDDNGSELYLGDLSAQFPSAGSMFAVATINNDGRYNLFGNSPSDDRWVANSWTESRPTTFRSKRAEPDTIFPYSSWPQSGSHVFAMESSSSIYRFVIDGTEIGTTGGDYNNGSGRSWTIGDRPGNGQQLNGDIAEMILYDRVLSTEEAAQVTTYLQDKYGMAARIQSFGGITGSASVIDQSAMTIAMSVPPGTDLATLAPAFTLSTGTCDQTSGTPPSPTFAVANPVTYTVTDGATINAYKVTVTVGSRPENDYFANAIELAGAIGTQTGTGNMYATTEADEPVAGADNTVWFKWTCAADGSLTINTLGSRNPAGGEWDAIVGLYSGIALNALTPLPGTPQDTGVPETMTVAVSAGTTYYIQAAGYGNDVAANILLNWSLAASVGPISVGSYGSGTLTFDAQPNFGQWATLAVGGATADVIDDAGLDSAMTGIDSSSIFRDLTSQGGSGTSGTAYWRADDQKLGTQPTGVKMTLLMASLRNTSGSTMDSLTVSYTMGMPTLTPGEQVTGHRVYWSKTGDAGTWTAVGDYLLTAAGTTLSVSFDVSSLAWASGELLYVVWADDNGVNPDGDYTLDDVSFAKTGGSVDGYGAWATQYAGGQKADEDYNNDGVQNGIAYFMGKTGNATNPGVVDGKVAWPHAANAIGITYKVMTSENLGAWTDVTGAAIDAGGFLTYTLPKLTAKLFVRLVVVTP